MVKQKLNSIEIASAIFDEALIAEHKAKLPNLTRYAGKLEHNLVLVYLRSRMLFKSAFGLTL